MHKFGDINVHFDELVPENTVSMRKATYEHITGKTLVDPTLPVRGEPGAIPRKGSWKTYTWNIAGSEPVEVPGTIGQVDRDAHFFAVTEAMAKAAEPPVAEEVEPAEEQPEG